MTTTWGAAPRYVLAAVTLLVLGLVAGRPEIVAAATPFVLAVVVGLCTRRPAITVELASASPVVQEAVPLALTATVTADRSTPCAVVRVEGTGESHAVALPAGDPVRVRATVTPAHWGRQHVGPATCSVNGLLATSPPRIVAVAAPVPISVLPGSAAFGASGPAPRAAGFAGRHRSQLPGAGVELAAVRPWALGDRPKRISWPASLRTGELHVASTLGDQAARVLVVIDSAYTGTGFGRAMRDVAVRAAAGIASHYLELGDRVGLAEYGGRNRLLPIAGGRGQITTLRNWLLDVGPRSSALPEAGRWLAALPAHGALVVVLSPLLDDRAAERLVVLRRRAASVVAIDTISPQVFRTSGDTARERTAWRLWGLEREVLQSRLREIGVPVIAWRGSGSLDIALRELSRLSHAPRAAAR